MKLYYNTKRILRLATTAAALVSGGVFLSHTLARPARAQNVQCCASDSDCNPVYAITCTKDSDCQSNQNGNQGYCCTGGLCNIL